MQKHVDALVKVVLRSHKGTSGANREAWGAVDEEELRMTKLSEAMMWRLTSLPSSR